VKGNEAGLTVFVPSQYPYVAARQFSGTGGEFGSGATYFRGHVPFSFTPGVVLESDVYLIVGSHLDARSAVYELHDSVQVFVDGKLEGTAAYGHPRPDVATNAYPNAPTHIGFSYSLDTKKYSNGRHTVVVKAGDEDGNTATFNSISVRIRN
jgi:hypothetical protein